VAAGIQDGPIMAAQAPRETARLENIEHLIFVRSPFGAWATTALLLSALVGLYALASAIDGAPMLILDGRGVGLAPRVQTALVLSLMGVAVLGLQRYSREREAAEAPQVAALVHAPPPAWETFCSMPRVRRLTLIGALVGMAAVAAVAPWNRHQALAGEAARLVWFAAVAAALGAMFLRGVEFSAGGARQMRLVVGQGLEIDLLDIDRLNPFGHRAARVALIWITVSAIMLLLFVGQPLSLLLLLPMALACLAVGAWVFVRMMGQVHAAIRRAKVAELARVRAWISTLLAELDRDADHGARLAGLIAYERRIAEAREWPLDQSTLVRLCVSSLILTAPWFGQAIIAVVVERLGATLH
jgi:hypothetical protein